MVITILLFVFGFFVLIKGAHVLVKSGSALAHFLGVSGFVIGTLVAGIGTSIPEFSVTFVSNLVDKNDVGLGAIIGSNTFNLLFIFGLCSLLYPLYLKREWVTRDLVWNICAVLITAVAATSGVITRLEGMIMVVLCILWIVTVAQSSRGMEKEGATSSALLLSFFLALAGLAAVLVGSYFVVDGATAIALDLGVSEKLVGLLLVGIGTSLPEVVVSLTAARKKQYGIAVGNIIGSNVFDFLGVIGATALVRSIDFNRALLYDLTITAAASVLILSLAFANTHHRLGRRHGLILLGLFIAYLVIVIIRG